MVGFLFQVNYLHDRETFEEQVLNWYVYNSFLNNNIWFKGTDIWKGLLAKQKHEVHPAAGRKMVR